MEIDRENYKKLVECCERFCRAEDDLYDLSATGKYGRDFYKFFNFLNVTRALWNMYLSRLISKELKDYSHLLWT